MSQPETELENESHDDGNDDAMTALLALGDKEESEEPEEEEEEAPETEGEEPEPKPKAKVKVGDDELDLDEVIAGYMKDGDYRKKTAEVAEGRKFVEAQVQQIQQERAYHANRLEVLIGAMHRELIGDQQQLQALLDENPHEYLRQKQAIDQKTQLFQSALAERQALANQAQQSDAQAKAHRLSDERKRLLNALPAWKDPAKAEAEQKEIGAFLVGLGYAPEELADLEDHRAVLLARDAMLWRKQKANKDKQVAAPLGKTVRPGVPQSDAPKAQAYQKALDRAKRSGGKTDDVVRLLMLKGS